jgi:hypothetical protein
MVQVTSDATRHLLRVREERGFKDSDGARFVRNAGRVGLTFAGSPGADDRVIEAGGIDIYLSPDVAEALKSAVIDARAEDGKTVLVFRATRDAAAARPS